MSKQYKHGGNIWRLAEEVGMTADQICDFSANINPLGPPPWAGSVINRNIDSLVNYPDPECAALKEKIAERYDIAAERIVVGNGSVEIMYAVARALRRKRCVISVPCYGDYRLAAESAPMEVVCVDMRDDENFSTDTRRIAKVLKGDEMVFIGSPNNPTGLRFEKEALLGLVKVHPESWFVIDEAFIDFAGDEHSILQCSEDNLIVLRSMTKFYAIAGIRLGFAVMTAETAELVQSQMTPWSVNTLAQAIGIEAVADDAYAEETRAFVKAQRKKLYDRLSAIGGLCVYPGEANFLLVRMEKCKINAEVLAAKLLAGDGIAIRVCDNFEGLDNSFFRVAVKAAEENERLINAIGKALGKKSNAAATKKKHSIMFQGTSSSAGKSFLTAALCRILLQDGVSVAPFKSQNMSLNSFVTLGGGEMGRAQVVQAQACKLDPDVRMNPVLLKPNSDTGSQVIVLGKPVGNMNVGEYTNYKSTVFETVKNTYDSLAAEYDVIVLEGAGSPAEINLKHHDIVNMRMARYAKSPVILVGDIDRGGVFASFAGTMELMEQWERKLMAGFIVNRFRGDASLLGPALDFTYRHTGKPVLGVVPYILNSGIPEEDSVQFKAHGFGSAALNGDGVEIAVVDLQHISNFTDFDPLAIEPDVTLKVARTASDIGTPDAVIIPGSKNVISDIAKLKDSGMAGRIKELAESGKTQVVGICAGFQILGEKINDPLRIESAADSADGIALLGITTSLAESKTLKLTEGKHIASALPVKGYEIHHGQTESGKAKPIILSDDGDVLGVSDSSGNVWGTYLHGIFDSDRFRRNFIDGLRERKGLEPVGKVCAVYDLEASFDRIADVMRENVNMDEIYRLLEL